MHCVRNISQVEACIPIRQCVDNTLHNSLDTYIIKGPLKVLFRAILGPMGV